MSERELRAAAEAYLAQTQAIHGDDACDARTTERFRAALAAPEHVAPGPELPPYFKREGGDYVEWVPRYIYQELWEAASALSITKE